MTTNQIKFAEHKENVRHNLETESQGRRGLDETGRHNLASEGIGRAQVGATYASIAEQRRHNIETEGINWFTAQNTAQLQQSQGYQAQSQGRYNDARTGWTTVQSILAPQQHYETVRHNQAQEGIGQSQVEVQQQQANIAAQQAQSAQQRADTEQFKTYSDLAMDVLRAPADFVGTTARSFRDVASGINSLWRATK